MAIPGFFSQSLCPHDIGGDIQHTAVHIRHCGAECAPGRLRYEESQRTLASSSSEAMSSPLPAARAVRGVFPSD